MKIDEEGIKVVLHNLNSEYEGFENVNIIYGVQRRPHELWLFLERYLIITDVFSSKKLDISKLHLYI